MSLRFASLAVEQQARRGRIHTSRGVIDTPAFMPVGTQGAVKAATPEEVAQTGAQIILGNTYHLFLRPGPELVRQLGGLHKMINWPGPLLTDSGGFQVYSLAPFRKVTDQGVTFQSHIDGSRQQLTPEQVIEVQEIFGSDIMMVLDECPPADAAPAALEAAVRRTSAWAKRSLAARRAAAGDLFAIIQGATNLRLRRTHLEELAALDFSGYALGGFSVGEAPESMWECVRQLAPLMPADKPRYLMGVGRPEDLLHCAAAGIDLFDCVMPTRNARNGQLFTFQGKVIIKHAKYREDAAPIEEGCPCPACRSYSRAYLRHLFLAKEILALRLMTLHNLTFYQRLMQRIRSAIEEGKLEATVADLLDRLRRHGDEELAAAKT